MDGIYRDQNLQFLGARPDGCGILLVEIKCPTKGLSELPYLRDMGAAGPLSLNPRSHYYGQIQGQMMVSSIYRSCFFIYCGVDEDFQF